MTWGEFKAAVEAAGVKDDTQLIECKWDEFYQVVRVDFGVDGSAIIQGDFSHE